MTAVPAFSLRNPRSLACPEEDGRARTEPEAFRACRKASLPHPDDTLDTERYHSVTVCIQFQATPFPPPSGHGTLFPPFASVADFPHEINRLIPRFPALDMRREPSCKKSGSFRRGPARRPLQRERRSRTPEALHGFSAEKGIRPAAPYCAHSPRPLFFCAAPARTRKKSASPGKGNAPERP